MKLTLLALSVILGVFKANATRYPAQFLLWQAQDEPENPFFIMDAGSYYVYNCLPTFEFSIEAVPASTDQVQSARIVTKGPTKTHVQQENILPYMVFGDRPDKKYVYDYPWPNNSVYNGDINGRYFEVGVYVFQATFYSKDNLRGKEVGTISVTLEVKDGACRVSSSAGPAEPEVGEGGRRLRGKPDGKE